MNEKNLEEIRYRRTAFKLFAKGKSVAQVLKHLPRSRTWGYKWRQRFEVERWEAWDSRSKAPHTSAHQYAGSTVKLVVRLRQHLERSAVGLVCAREIRREVMRQRLLRRVPSLSTINRWLKQAGLIRPTGAPTVQPYYPQPHPPEEVRLYACDWTARYLAGGEKPYVMHTLEVSTHALSQTINTDKTTEALCHHVLAAFTELGLPDLLQIDNDGAFTGLGKRRRGVGRFVRVLLYLGVEPIFLPPGEPKRNGLVESLHHLWARSFFDKNHFASVAHLKRQSPKFLAWYDLYEPPQLGGVSVAAARRRVLRRRLTQRERHAIPQELPLTAGRLHFIRRVDARGQIRLLNESWKVSKRLVGEYVWATVDLKAQSLQLSYRKSERAKAKLVQQFAYPIAEPVKRLAPQYKRRARRVKVLSIM
jgi:putative transposase